LYQQQQVSVTLERGLCNTSSAWCVLCPTYNTVACIPSATLFHSWADHRRSGHDADRDRFITG